MFKREVKPVDDLVLQFLRLTGLETPLLQRRVINSWDKVAGELVAKYTVEKYIYNQTLMVKISNPALRADLSMMRSQLVKSLNSTVGSNVIYDIKFY